MTWPQELPLPKNLDRLKPPPKSYPGAMCLELREYENAHKLAAKSLRRDKLFTALLQMREIAHAYIQGKYPQSVRAAGPETATVGVPDQGATQDGA